MRKLLIALMLFICSHVLAQQQVAVYTKSGSKLIGEIVKRDSVAGKLTVKIQGGSELPVLFSDIDKIEDIRKVAQYNAIGNPYFAFGLGAATNAERSVIQLDLLMGYRFSSRFKAGMGFCATSVVGVYTDLNYDFLHRDFFSLGVYSQPGMVLANLSNSYYYYGSTNKVNGFYSNSGLSFGFKGLGRTNFSIHTGFQYAKVSESYMNWNGTKEANISRLNRYVIEGILEF